MTDEQKADVTTTLELRFVPRIEGGRLIRVLQHRTGTSDWQDVPFVEDEEQV